MIYPTQRAVWLVAAAAPVALAVGIVAPGAWVAALGWVALMLVLVVVDALLAPPLGSARLSIATPAAIHVGETFDLAPRLEQDTRVLPAAFAAEISGPLEREGPRTSTRFRAVRRGRAEVQALWARHAGPMGLAWRQTRRPGGQAIAVMPDIRPVRDEGMRQYLNSQHTGLRMRRDSGEGQEFQVLTDFQPGMERRTIDWKASAKHASLLAREYQTERDNAVVFAVDAGRAMSDPVGGVPRVDRAVSAALLAAFVALKSGDRVRLYSFAARPQVDSGTLSGTRGFTRLHHAAADIDYGTDESNYTLSLVTLDGRLERRSLVVLFTEFTDPTSAELMLAAAQRMLKRHRLLFVLFRDEELEGIQDAEPKDADDVVRATVAHALLRERRIVIERLRRMGVDVIEAPAEAMALKLVERYLRHRERVA